MTTDNTQARLAEQIESLLVPNGYDDKHFEATGDFKAVITVTPETIEAILDWHNKQIEEVLDRLSNQQEKLHWWTGGEYEKTTAVDMRAIEAERNKLKDEL